jgi:hypothetical protein
MIEKIQVSGMKERRRLNKLGVSKDITNTLSGREASKLLNFLLRSKQLEQKKLPDITAQTVMQAAA